MTTISPEVRESTAVLQRPHPAVVFERESIGRPTVLVVERHEFIRSCVVTWLQSSCPEFSVVPFAGIEPLPGLGVSSGLALAIISDDPSEAGTEWIERQSDVLRASFPQLPVMAITTGDKLQAVADACTRLGLKGFLPTWTAAPVAAAVVRLIVAGGAYFPLTPHRDETAVRSSGRQARFAHLTAGPLSSRELAVAELVGRGLQNKLIAYELNISVSTVKAHLHRITKKLKLKNRTELAVMVRTPNGAPATT